MNRTMGNKRAIAVFVLPGLFIYLLMFILPIGATAYISVFDWPGYGKMEFTGLGNYIRLMTEDLYFWKGVKNTFILFVILIVAQIPPALLLALLLHHFTHGLRFFKTVFFVPMMISAVAMAILWQKVFEPNFGMMNEFFRWLGVGEQLWLSDPKAAIFAVSLTIAWAGLGFHFILLYAGLKGIPESYYEAAKIDGANGLKATWHITLPLLRDILKVCVVMAAIGALKIFDQVYVMTGGGPMKSTMTVAIQMYDQAFLSSKFGSGSAIAIFLLVECLIIAYVLNKLLTRERVEF